MRSPSFVLNPQWPHYLGVLALSIAVILGVLRSTLFDWADPDHCHALLDSGSWLDKQWKNWQPQGCMIHTYNPKDSGKCLDSSRIIFIGDSITRLLFFQFASILDPKLPQAPPNDNTKHSDHNLESSQGTKLDFIWDPYLNLSHTTDILTTDYQKSSSGSVRPALLVLGSGLWYLQNANETGGVPAWEKNMADRVTTVMLQSFKPADITVMLPVENVIPSKLSPRRAAMMHPSDIDAMNSDLYHRLNPSDDGFWGSERPQVQIILPRVFNDMLDASQTEDGLHFSDQIVKAQANILLNLRCNNHLSKAYPLNKTCCNRYPTTSLVHALVLFLVLSWGPYTWFRNRKSAIGFEEFTGNLLAETNDIPALVLSTGAFLIYLADRTGLWLKEQKQFDFWAFTFLSISTVAYGLFTIKKGDKDLGFLNRDQTDEWKGWMQLAILIYHYFGASKISGIYNPIRVLVASYLFMSGYGHTTFYLRKADYSFLRVAQTMIRLNLLTVLLAYTMNTDYMFYYFAPLVSMWYLILYATLFVGSQYNERTTFLLGKIFLSASIVTWFFKSEWPLQILFGLLKDVFNIRWSAREWTFRVTLDLWIVYVGMLSSIAVIKIREYRLTDHPKWPVVVKVTIVSSILILVWFFAFELVQEDKFAYNAWHPYVSPLAVLAFVVVRNANGTLRSTSSKAFMFVGKCSLELFIMQYHFWLAGDTKGVLLVIPGTQWRPINFVFTSLIFVYLCHRMANATGDVTKIFCSTPMSLPTTNTNGNSSGLPMISVTGPASPSRGTEAIPLMSTSLETPSRKDNDENPLPPEPDTPIRPAPSRRWVDRLADESSPIHSSPSRSGFRWLGKVEWLWSLPGRSIIFLCFLWIVNISWTYTE